MRGKGVREGGVEGGRDRGKQGGREQGRRKKEVMKLLLIASQLGTVTI